MSRETNYMEKNYQTSRNLFLIYFNAYQDWLLIEIITDKNCKIIQFCKKKVKMLCRIQNWGFFFFCENWEQLMFMDIFKSLRYFSLCKFYLEFSILNYSIQSFIIKLIKLSVALMITLVSRGYALLYYILRESD